MARFDRQIATALKLIAKNGEKVVWRVIPNATFIDPNKPWEPSESIPEDNEVSICFLPIDRITMETLAFMKGSEVPKGWLMGLMGNVPFDPNLKDVVIRNGVELRIDNVVSLSPNGQKILYTIVFQQ